MITFHARHINHGQSEVWVEGGKARIVATNAIRNCIQKNADAQTFKAFWEAYPAVGGDAVTFQVPENAAVEYGLIR